MKVALSALAQLLKRRGDGAVRGAEQGLDEFADYYLARVQANTPVRTGTLRDSEHKVTFPTEGTRARRDIVAETPYAYAVHERPPEMDHAHEGEGTEEGYPGREFLSRPLRFHKEKMAPAVREGAMAGMRKA